MKKYILGLALVATVAGTLTSCSDDDLSDVSVIKDSQTTENAFDKWLYNNFVTPYNIEIQYRYNDNESDMQYYDVPADSAQSVEMAHIIKYTCVDAYTQAAGMNFTRTYFPKLFSFLGEFEYENNGAMKLGTAERGKKIRLLGVNHLDTYIHNREYLNEYYMKTIHHEFVHIVNQTKDYPREFDKVTANGYVNDAWSSETYESGYLTRGFITDYSQKEAREDFAEMVSTYVTKTPAEWNALMAQAKTYDATTGKVTSTTGYDALQKKLDICKQYYKESFGIDLDKVRDEVVSREENVVNGKIDLRSLK